MEPRYRTLLPLFVTFLLLSIAPTASAEIGDTTRVRVFDSLLWVNHGGQDRTALFPDTSKRYEKILMHFRLKCPTGGCGEWDYTMNVYVMRRTGVLDTAGKEIIEPIEIGRFITPYGKWFRKDREFDWVFDVTDYAYLLRDSVTIRTFYDGWSQGSIYTLDFDLIEGIPARDVFKVENLYTGGFTYGDTANPIENRLPERTLAVDPRSTNTTLKITTTGHGFGGTENAAEFSEKTHLIRVNGQQRYSQHLWRSDCGQNPVYPQAGTWYFQRAGWCPGDLVHPDFYDLSPYVTDGEVRVDYNMQPYVNADPSKPATYIIHAQALYATGPNFTNNIALEAVQRPSMEFRWHRMNPVCPLTEPIISMKNTGSAPLRRATITYGVEGGAQRTYNWTGNLGFMKSIDVTLPPIDLGTASGRFTVTLSEPNGVADEYPRDNAMTTSFEMPKVATDSVRLTLRTDDYGNLAGDHNGISWQIVDANGNIVESGEGYADRTVYRQTIPLPPGCYRFIIYDSQVGDGLFPIQGTAGNYQLVDGKGQVIINAVAGSPDYLASFGDREITSFLVTSSSGAEAPSSTGTLDAISVHPNPSTGLFTIDLGTMPTARALTVTVTALDGREVLRRVIDARQQTHRVDLTDQPAGTYVMRIDAEGDATLRKLVIEPR